MRFKKGQKIEIGEVKKAEPKLILPEEMEENHKRIERLEEELDISRRRIFDLEKQVEEGDLTQTSHELHEYNQFTDYIEVRFTAHDDNPVRIFLVSLAGTEFIAQGNDYKEAIKAFREKLKGVKDEKL